MDRMTPMRWATPWATERAGEALASCLEPGDAIGLVGDLGAGKTLLVRGIARGLAIPPGVRVTSPTFTLLNEYRGGRIPLYHADLYRLEARIELDELGLDDVCRRGDGAVCVEWHDRFPVLGSDYLAIHIELAENTESAGASASLPSGAAGRVVTARGTGTRSRALADAWLARLRDDTGRPLMDSLR